MFRRMKLVVSALVILLILGIGGELFHGMLASVIWHWRNGDSIAVAGIEVSVPKPWFVDQANNMVVELGRPHLPTLRGIPFESRITVSVSPKAVTDLQFWESQENALYAGTLMGRREIRTTAQDRIVCFEGKLVQQALKITNSNLITVNCQSNGRLNLSFTGTEKDLPEFYTIVERIRFGT